MVEKRQYLISINKKHAHIYNVHFTQNKKLENEKKEKTEMNRNKQKEKKTKINRKKKRK